MKLDNRLSLIASKVCQCNSVCDIGTDHAYIPIYLINNKVINRAIAVDINKGPLEFAKANLNRYNLNSKIETRLGNGLNPLKKDEVEVVIVAGMGGELISQILSIGIDKIKNCKQIILQPMNEIPLLRKWLHNNQFIIVDEELTTDGKKIYDVITTRWIGKKEFYENEFYYEIGKMLIEKKDKILVNFLNKKINTIKIISENLQNEKNIDNFKITKFKELELQCRNLLFSLEKE